MYYSPARTFGPSKEKYQCQLSTMSTDRSQEEANPKMSIDNPQEEVMSAETEELLNLQLMDKEALEKQWKNLNKEPNSRKTEKRLQAFEDKSAVLWSAIQERHDVLKDNGEIKSTPYIVEDYFQFAADIRKRIAKRLEKDRKDLRLSAMGDDKVIQNRSVKLVLLKRFIELNGNIDEDEPTESEVAELIETLERLHREYCYAQQLIPAVCARFDDFVHETEMIATDVLELMGRLTSIKVGFEHALPSIQGASSKVGVQQSALIESGAKINTVP